MINILHSPLNPSGFNRGDKGYLGGIHSDEHAIIIFGEDDGVIHTVRLLSGEYIAVPKIPEFVKEIYIVRPRFWGRFIKPREKK